MKILGKILVGIVAAVVSLSLMAGAASADAASSEGDFVARLNDLRSAQGLGTLSVDPALTDMARAWSSRMAAADAISHNPNLASEAPPSWMKLGENVGVGPTVGSLHDAFVASPHHYTNMIDPAFTKVGIGVVEVGDTMYVTVDFMTAAGEVASAAAAPAQAAKAGKATVCTGKGKKRRCQVAAPRRVKAKVAKKAKRR